MNSTIASPLYTSNEIPTAIATQATTAIDADMFVTKRDKPIEIMSFDKILKRIKNVGKMSNIENINYTQLAIKVIDQLYNGIPTAKIDELMAEQCAMLSTKHPNYSALANGMIISTHQKNTTPSFLKVITDLYYFKDINGMHSPLVSTELINFAQAYSEWIDRTIDHSRDYLIDYFGFKTLERNYLFSINGVVVERIQHMWMRVSIGIHYNDILFKTGICNISVDKVKTAIKETYDLMSQKYFIHATPTLFNSGTPHPQLSSCFLVAMEDDSIEGIFNTLKDCALISKYSGGIGMHIHNIRGKKSFIRGTNGVSNGIVPMLRVFNNTARYVDQSGKRAGSFAIYLEPHHPDIEDFLEMRKNHGDEESKARDLFYALWISDLFMERVKANASWSLFCPNECPGLSDVWGDEYKALYGKYEVEGRAKKTIKARDLWLRILDAQMETGTPFLLFKDAANRKSNQQNIGTIKSSNLCTEIIQYSDEKETAVCNLASIALPTYVNPITREFDYKKLHYVAKVITRNLNNVIDINFYPTEKAANGNKKHRPIGIGVQGLADVFILMNVAYHSNEARAINRLIFETMYHAALESSMELAQKDGAYETFKGSPASNGILQFDMWNVVPTPNRYDWALLKDQIREYGLRNSLLLAPMPTASTSQILGFNECFEPLTNNIYTRRTLAGEFVVINKYLLRDLIELGVWTDKLKNNIIENQGSVQYLPDNLVPQNIKEKYKTVWEIPMRHLIDMSADRGAFICQSQSLNLWLEDPTYGVLTSMHFYAWTQGLKTGIYYLRRKAKHQAQQFTIEPELNKNINDLEDDEICEMCSA